MSSPVLAAVVILAVLVVLAALAVLAVEVLVYSAGQAVLALSVGLGALAVQEALQRTLSLWAAALACRDQRTAAMVDQQVLLEVGKQAAQ